MTILLECQNCYYVFREEVDEAMDMCPNCGWAELLEVKRDWNKD